MKGVPAVSLIIWGCARFLHVFSDYLRFFFTFFRIFRIFRSKTVDAGCVNVLQFPCVRMRAVLWLCGSAKIPGGS